MQEHTHLARLFGGIALPLTLFAQGTEATTADAGRVDHAQTPISFPTPLVCHQRLACRTAKCPIRLDGKVLTGEAPLLEGANPPEEEHSLREEQWRSYAPDQEKADVPVPARLVPHPL